MDEKEYNKLFKKAGFSKEEIETLKRIKDKKQKAKSSVGRDEFEVTEIINEDLVDDKRKLEKLKRLINSLQADEAKEVKNREKEFVNIFKNTKKDNRSGN